MGTCAKSNKKTEDQKTKEKVVKSEIVFADLSPNDMKDVKKQNINPSPNQRVNIGSMAVQQSINPQTSKQVSKLNSMNILTDQEVQQQRKDKRSMNLFNDHSNIYNMAQKGQFKIQQEMKSREIALQQSAFDPQRNANKRKINKNEYELWQPPHEPICVIKPSYLQSDQFQIKRQPVQSRVDIQFDTLSIRNEQLEPRFISRT